VRDFGADAAFVTAELDAKLAEILSGAQEIHFPFGREPCWTRRWRGCSGGCARASAAGRARRCASSTRG
jgi:hypothetical protein